MKTMVAKWSTFALGCFANSRAVFVVQLRYFYLLLLVAILLIGCSSNVPSFTFLATAAGTGDDTRDIYMGTYQRGEIVVKQVTRTPELELFPTLSPDEKWILYKIDGTRLENRLYLLNLPTGRTEELERGGYVIPGPFKPDGSSLTYMSDSVDGIHRLFVVDIDKMEPKMVPIGVGEQEIVSISWGPDGQRIAVGVVSSRHDLNPDSPSIYIYEFEDGSLKRLTHEEDGACEWPAWSPSGDWIAAVCSRDADFGELYLISSDGKKFRRLTQTPATLNQVEAQQLEYFRWIERPQWLPNGKFILYRAIPELNRPAEFRLTDLDGNSQRLDLGKLQDIRSLYVKP